jgi:hypothetical protein
MSRLIYGWNSHNTSALSLAFVGRIFVKVIERISRLGFSLYAGTSSHQGVVWS